MPQQSKQFQEFHGRSGEMKDSEWLAVEDIVDVVPLDVTIVDVRLRTNVPMEDGRREAKVYSLAFENAKKELIVNATNRRALVSAFGTKVDQWRGKVVTLTVEKLRREFNGRTHGIRVRIGGVA